MVFDGFLLESIGEIVSSDGGSMGGLGFELVETEVVVVLEFGEGLFFGDPVAELDAGVGHEGGGEDEIGDLLVLLFGDCDDGEAEPDDGDDDKVEEVDEV